MINLQTTETVRVQCRNSLKKPEKTVSDRSASHLNDFEINLHRMQLDFCKHHPTETAICCFAKQIKSYLDNGGVVGAVFLDSTEAPDNVNHNVLLSKISKSNFYFSLSTS